MRTVPKPKPSPLRQAVLDLLLPTRCLGCRQWTALNDLGLCRECRSRLSPLLEPRCRTCLTDRVPHGGSHCLRCQGAPPAYQRLYALYHYQPPFDQVIRALKFRRLPYLSEALAIEAWDRYAEQLSAVDVLVPVPLPWTRLLRRGYNQAELLARSLATQLERPLMQPLARRLSPLQSEMEKEIDRRRNARRSLHLARRLAFPNATSLFRTSLYSSSLYSSSLYRSSLSKALDGQHVLLVDDLVTSGATADRAAQLLLSAGARQVSVLAAGHRP